MTVNWIRLNRETKIVQGEITGKNIYCFEEKRWQNDRKILYISN